MGLRCRCNKGPWPIRALAVPDRQLLARLCLAREDAWEVDRTLFERGAYEGRLMPAGGGDTGVPERAPSLVFPTELPRVQLGFLATVRSSAAACMASVLICSWRLLKT